MYKIFRLLAVAGGLAMVSPLAAQDLGNSPYSRLGVGDLVGNTSSIRFAGMGGVGVSNANGTYLNDLNPAQLYYNNLVIFEMGVNGQLKKIATSERSQVDGSASLAYVALGIPFSKRWTAAIGLRPFSRVNYQSSGESPVIGSPNPQERVISTSEGSGGLSEAYFAHGVKIYKGLSAGVSASYIFGVINNNLSNQIVGTGDAALNTERFVVNNRTSYSDFMFKTGLAYRGKLTGKFNYNAGLMYGFKADVDTERRRVSERRTASDLVIERVQTADSLEGYVTLPQSIQAGVSIDNGRNWSLALDFTTQQWSDFYSSYDLVQQDLGDSYRIGVGSEYTPNATSVNNYLQNITYRGGLTYGKTLAKPGGDQLSDVALSLGFSLPLKFEAARPQDRSLINLAFTAGQRGTTDNAQIKENYYRISVGITANNRWFQKRRIE